MAVLNSIIEKLKCHMVETMGFIENGGSLLKKLTGEDLLMSNSAIKSIMNGKAYKGLDPVDTIQSILIDNYIGEKIMDNAIYDIELSEEEKEFFECDDDDDDDFGYNGYSEIESWVAEQNIFVDRDELLAFIDAAMLAT